MTHAEPQSPAASFRTIDPQAIAVQDRYKLLIGSVVPRPIAFVSTIDHQGRTNLAPYSFFAGIGSNPMSVLFCPSNKPDGTDKDSLANARPPAEGGTGEFVVNMAIESYLRAVAGAAEPLPHGESEFDLVGLTPAPSEVVRPPRVLESPVSFECRTLQVIRMNPGVAGGGNIVIGEVVRVWVREDLINDRLHIDQQALHAVGRMGGLRYCRTGSQTDLAPGRGSLEGGDVRW